MRAIPRKGAEALPANLDRQRVDKWLWHARVTRHRTDASALADEGHVRVNGVRIQAASRMIRVGDVLTISLNRRVRVLQVGGFVARRGSAESARVLYIELTSAADGDTPQSLAKA